MREVVAAAEAYPLLLPSSSTILSDFFQYSPPTRFGTHYREDIERSENTTTYLHANVVDIVLNDTLGAVDHLECATLSGLSFAVSAGRFVFATGALENARILLASNHQIDVGIGNQHDLVRSLFHGASSLLLFRGLARSEQF